MYICITRMCAHKVHMVVRGHLDGVCSLILPIGSMDQTHTGCQAW